MSKTIAVIGVGPGVGLAVAERFGREGFNVALLARRPQSLNEFAAQLKAKGIEAAAFPADVLNRAGLATALDRATKYFGTLDVLEYSPTPTADRLRRPIEIDVENEQFQLDIGVLGAISAVRAVLPAWIARGSGSLLFTTAASSYVPIASTASFGVAAGALLNYARVLNPALAAHGIYAGIVSIAGLVVQKGKDGGVSANGLSLIAAQDIADLHWRLHTSKDRVEATLGDLEVVRKLSGR